MCNEYGTTPLREASRICILLFVAGLIAGAILATAYNEQWQRHCVQAGVGRFNPDTGNFELGRFGKGE